MAIEVNGTDIPNGSEFYVNSAQVQEAYCNGVLIWWFEVEPPDEVPAAITDFNASDNLTGRVKVTFTPSSNATEHDLYRDGSMVKDKVTSGFEDVIAAGTYVYYVKAQNSTGDTDSNTDNGTSVEEQGGTPPSTINNFNASDNVINAIVISFTNASGDPTPTHDLIRVATGTTIVSNVTPGHSWSTTEQNVLLRVDAKNTEGVTPSNTDYGSAEEDTPVGEAPGYNDNDAAFYGSPDCYAINFHWDTPDTGTPPFTYVIVGDIAGEVYRGGGNSFTLNGENRYQDWNFRATNDYGQTNENMYRAGAEIIPDITTRFSASDNRTDGVMLEFERPGNIDNLGHYELLMNGNVIHDIQDNYSYPASRTWLHTGAPIGVQNTYQERYKTYVCEFVSPEAQDVGMRLSGIRTPDYKVYIDDATFMSPIGYRYVDLVMCDEQRVYSIVSGNKIDVLFTVDKRAFFGYASNAPCEEITVSWGYKYWEVIPGYNTMSEEDRWIAIDVYNTDNNIPEWMIYDPNGLSLTTDQITEMENNNGI